MLLKHQLQWQNLVFLAVQILTYKLRDNVVFD